MSLLDFLPMANISADTNDYEQDGVLICGNCKTPRQMWVPLAGENKLVPVLCRCRTQKRDQVEREWRDIQKRQAIEQLQRVGITDKRYEQMTFENSEIPLPFAKSYVQNWTQFERDNVGLMILGDTGTGKTYAAACIANTLLNQGISVYMANIMSVCDRLTGLYDEGRLSYIASLKKYRLLVLDDFGVERNTDFMQEQIYSIIETRYRSGRPLIITSNLELSQFRDCDALKYARTYDRLKEMCHPVEMKGQSRRRAIANNRYRTVEKILAGGST